MLKRGRGRGTATAAGPCAGSTHVDDGEATPERRSAEGDLEVRFPAAGWIELTAPSTEEYLERIAGFLDSLAGRKIGKSLREEVKAVATEIVSNAIEWGNRGDANRRIHVSYALFDDEVVLKCEDEGDGFDPGQIPDPEVSPSKVVGDRLREGKRLGGFGIHLARKLMDRIVFSERGNVVLLSKSLRRKA